MAGMRLMPDPDLPAPLPQHPWCAAIWGDIGLRAEARMMPGGAGQVVLMRRRFGPLGDVVLASRGPVWSGAADSGARQQALRSLARDGLRLVEAESADDADDLRACGYARLVTPAHVAELALTGGHAALLTRAFGKWRNRLQQARSAGLVVCHAQFDPVRHGWLTAAEAIQRRTRRYHAWPLAFAQAWATRHPASAMVFWAESGGVPVAGMLILRHGPVATYHIGWSGTAGRRASAHHLILMQAADWLADAGTRRLDLGAVDTEGAPGLARFKIGTGARVRPLGGSWIRLFYCGTGINRPTSLKES